jgi:chitin disaccharide deacetylase
MRLVNKAFPANLLINADDFGLDIRISREIFRCIEKGLIHSISILPFAVGDKEHEALLARIVAEYPEVRLGAHLSLIETAPVLASTPRYSQQCASAPNHRAFLAMYFSGRIRPSHIRSEWKAQLELLARRVGKERIAHIDSHQHVHVLPGIWGITAQLRRDFGIPRLRVPYEGFLRSLTFRFPFGIAFQSLAWLRAQQVEGTRMRFAGFFTSMHFNLDAHQSWLERVSRHPEIGHELVVHPGQAPDGSFAEGREIDELWRLHQSYGIDRDSRPL